MSRRPDRHRPNNQQPPVADPTILQPRPQQQTPTRVSASITTSYHGPLPPPEMLERYNQVLPNGAERIVAIAESQMRHRQGLESRRQRESESAGTRAILCLCARCDGHRRRHRPYRLRQGHPGTRFHHHGSCGLCWCVHLWQTGAAPRKRTKAPRTQRGGSTAAPTARRLKLTHPIMPILATPGRRVLFCVGADHRTRDPRPSGGVRIGGLVTARQGLERKADGPNAGSMG